MIEGTPRENALLALLVERLDGHSVDLVNQKEGRRLGFSVGRGRSIALCDILALADATRPEPPKGLPTDNLPEAVRQFLVDSSWRMPSAITAPNACLELRALRRSWLAAIEAIGLTEEEAREAARGLYRRAPPSDGDKNAAVALDMLFDLAGAAYRAADEVEETGPVGESIYRLRGEAFEDLSDALDKLDELPDDQPGYIMGPAAKAAWALRAVRAALPSPKPEGA